MAKGKGSKSLVVKVKKLILKRPAGHTKDADGARVGGCTTLAKSAAGVKNKNAKKEVEYVRHIHKQIQ